MLKPVSITLRLVTVLVALFLLPEALGARSASEDDGFLTIGAIQFAVSREVYSSTDSFRTALIRALDTVEAQAVDDGVFPDLIVFPEYTSAFLGLSVLSDEQIAAFAADPAGNRRIVAEAISRTNQDMMDIWMEISAAKPYAILTGSHLNVDSKGNIRNRALVFDSGQIIWSQDKVFPGLPEIRILQLTTGVVEDAIAFEVDGFSIVTTICRDTYNEIWETTLPEADLWIDIKANELVYTQEYYDEALTARLPGSPIDRGLTVSLSGEILGFRFTGPTEYLYNSGPIAGTDPYAENAVLVLRLPAE